jgi:hypothetical protein
MTAAEKAPYLAVKSDDEHTDSEEDEDDDPKENASKKAKTKKAKDPNAPKRPMSAYMYYSVEQVQLLKSQQPDMPFGNVRHHHQIIIGPMKYRNKNCKFETHV